MVTEQQRKEVEYIYGELPPDQQSLEQSLTGLQAEIDRVGQEQAARAQGAKNEIERIQRDIDAQTNREFGVYESELTRENRLFDLNREKQKYQRIAASPGNPNESQYVNLLSSRINTLKNYTSNEDLAKKRSSFGNVESLRTPGGSQIATISALERAGVLNPVRTTDQIGRDAGYVGKATIDPRSQIFGPTDGLFSGKATPSRDIKTNIKVEQGVVKPQNPRKQILRDQPDTEYSNPGFVKPSQKQSSISSSNIPDFVGASAGVKSVVPPIQNRELKGTKITARQYKDIVSGNGTTPNIFQQVTSAPNAFDAFKIQKGAQAKGLGTSQVYKTPKGNVNPFDAGGFEGRQSNKILPQILPSSSAFLSIPGVQFAAGEVAPPQAPRPPPKLTQAQVNALSDSEYAQYQADFERYNQEYSQYQKDYAGYADTIKIQNKVARLNAAQINLQSDKDLKKYLADTKAEGYKLISFATPTGEKTVPIDRAYREIRIASKNVTGIGAARLDKRYGAGQNITGISAVPILESGNVFAGSISNPILLSEPEKKPYGPQVGATFGAQKEFERITGLKTGLQPITSRIDAAFELDKPLQQRSPDARAVGTFLAPATNLVGGLANLGKIAIGKGELTGERAGALNLPQYKEAPQERTTLGDIMEGRPVNLNDPFARISLYGEAALFGAGILGAKAGNKLGQKIETKIKVGAETREAKTVAKGLARQSDAPFGISKKGRAFEFEQGIEPARTRGFKITEKIDPTLQLKRIGRTVEAKFTKTPKQTNIPEVPKNPQPRVPYAYIQPGKRGVTAEVLSKPIKGSKDEIGAIIKGTLSRQERKRLGASLASEPGSPLDIYTVKATDSVIKVLSQAEKSGYLKRITDIRLSPTKEAVKTVRKGNQSFYEKYIKSPQTVGYYETLQGTGRKTTQTTGYQTPLGSKSLNEQLKRIGLSTAEARRTRSYKPMTSFGDIKVNIGTGGSVGKAQSISKQDENILRNLVPKLAGETKKKPRQDAFGDIEKSFPYAGLGYGGEDQAFAYEPESISRRRPLTGFAGKESNLARLTGKSLINTNEELKRAIKVVPDVGSLRITIPKLGIRPETRQRQPQGLGLFPITGQTPAQRTTPVQRQTPLTTPKTVPIEVPITIPDIKIPPPRYPPYEPPFKFPRGKFGFLIPGGGTGGLGRGPKARIKKFVASEADPLRAGVLVPDNVTELVGYSPAVFRQIDINLGKERRRKGRTGGIDAEPFKGFGDNLLIKNNLNIRL